MKQRTGSSENSWPSRSSLTTRSDRCSCASAFRHRPSPLRNLTDYIQEQWIESTVFTPKDWSVFKQPIRTNNDIEGWHNALNRRAGGQCRLQFYLLIELLHREARLTSITIKLVSDKKLKRIQRRKYRQLQQKLFDAWEQYQTGNKSASQLLRCCSHLNGPARCQ